MKLRRLAASSFLLAATAACTVLLDQNSTQCQSNVDCARFTGAHCDVAQRVCVTSALDGAGGEQGSAGVSGNSGSNGAGGTSGSSGSTGSGGDGGGSPDAASDAAGGSSGSSGQGGGPGGAGGTLNNPCPMGAKPLVDFNSNITTDATLSCDKDYLLVGTVFVDPGVTLTIQPGTTIKGSPQPNPGILVIRPGARLIAKGSRIRPIVFTSAAAEGSQKPGDWGGLILLGRAPSNHRDAGGQTTTGKIEGLTSGGDYGGDVADDSSGELSYVRIEYSGVAIAPNNEVNGLTFGGVGSGTIVDNVQVRQTADDCFEFFGGTVNAKHLICQYNGDDGFDWDNGYQGKLQFLVLQQDPKVADETNGFEGDNDALGTANTPLSAPTIYNATLCGKNVEVAKQQYGMVLRRSTRATIANVLTMGFEAGIDLRDASTAVDLTSSIFFGNLVHNVAYPEDGSDPDVNKDDDAALNERTWFSATERKNSERDPAIAGCFDANNPRFAPASSLTEGAATPPSDGFFDPSANFIGAFRNAADAWAQGAWVRWSDR